MFQPPARVRQADALGHIVEIAKRDAETVVANADLEMTIAANCVYVDPAAARTWRDAMLDGVLDKRLQDHVRHAGVERFRRDLYIDRKPVVKAHLFDLEVFSEKFQLLLQRDLLNFEVVQ